MTGSRGNVPQDLSRCNIVVGELELVYGFRERLYIGNILFNHSFKVITTSPFSPW